MTYQINIKNSLFAKKVFTNYLKKVHTELSKNGQECCAASNAGQEICWLRKILSEQKPCHMIFTCGTIIMTLVGTDQG